MAKKVRQDAIVQFRTPNERAEREAARGITRDAEGRIIRSKEWIKKRIAWLEFKKKDLQNRIKNIEAELKERSK